MNETIVHGESASVVDQVLALKETAQLNYLLRAPLGQASFDLITDEEAPKLG